MSQKGTPSTIAAEEACQVKITRLSPLEPRLLRASPDLERFAKHLTTLKEPVGLFLRHWSQIKMGAFSVNHHRGPVIVRRWSLSGRETYSQLPVTQGYCLCFTFQHSRFMPGRISLVCFSLYDEGRFSKFNLRFNMQWTALFPFGGPAHKALQLGDEAYLKRKLASRALRISDTTANGDTLLHVCMFIFTWCSSDI